MSETIEHKDVELRFNSDEFERKAAKALKTLGDLSKALLFEKPKQALVDFGKRIKDDFVGNIEKATSIVPNMIKTIKKSFRQLTTGYLWDLGKRFYGDIESTLRSFIWDPLTSGWGKFSDKTSAVATLVGQGFDLTEVEEQMARLNFFTDETSYSLIDMVQNIGKFTASGKGLTESVDAMQGIANWAALSGQSASKASSAMYQLSQAMGSGVMRKEDYKSIQNLSMDTMEFRKIALDTAAALGTIRKNADGTFTSIVEGAKESTFKIEQFADNLTQEQWFTDKVMMEVYKKYSSAVDKIYQAVSSGQYDTASEAIEGMSGEIDEFGLKAFLAAQQARTLQDAIDSVKDAVSSQWMKIYESIFGNYEEAADLWTTVANEAWNIFAGPLDSFASILDEWKQGGGRTMLMQAFGNIWEGFGNVIRPLKEGWRAIFPEKTAEDLLDWTERFREGTQKFAAFFKPAVDFVDDISQKARGIVTGAEGVSDAVDNIAGSAKEAVAPVKATVEKLDELAQLVIGGKYGTGKTRFEKLAAEGFVPELVQNKVNELLGCAYRYDVVVDEIAESTEELAESSDQNARSMENNVVATAKSNKRAKNLTKIFKGLAAAIDVFKTVLGEVKDFIVGLFGVAWDTFGRDLFDFVLEKLAKLGDAMVKLRQNSSGDGILKGLFDWLLKLAHVGLTAVAEAIKNIAIWIGQFIESARNSSQFPKLVESFGKLKDMLIELGKAGLDKITEFFDSFLNTEYDTASMDTFADKAVGALSNFIDYIVEHKDDVITFFEDSKQKIEDTFNFVSNFLDDAWKDVNDFWKKVEPILTSIQGFFDQIWKDIQPTVEGVQQALGNALKTLTDMFMNADMGTFAQTLGKGALAAAFITFVDILKKFSDGVTSIPTSIVELLGQLQGTLVAYQTKVNATAIEQIGKGILMFCVGMFALALIPTEKLRDVVGYMIILMAVMAMLLKAWATFRQVTMAFEAGKATATAAVESAKGASALADGVKKAAEAATSTGEKAAGLANGFKDVLGQFVEGFNGGITLFLGRVSQGIKNAVQIAAVGLLVYSFGKGIYYMVESISSIIKMLNDPNIGQEKLEYAVELVGRFVVLIVMMNALYKWVSKFGGQINTADIFMLISFAASVAILGMVVAEFTLLDSLNHTAFVNASLAVAGIMAVLGLAVISIVGMSQKIEAAGNAINKVSLFMLAFAVTVNLLVLPIMLLSLISPDRLKAAGNAIIKMGVVIGALALIAWAVGNVEPKTMLKSLGSFLSIVLLLGTLVGAMAIVGTNADVIMTGLETTMQCLVAFGVIVAVGALAFTFFSDAIFGFVLSMGLFGAGVALLGIGVLGLSKGLQILPDALKGIVEWFVWFANYFKDHWFEIAVGVALVIGAVALGIAMAKGNVIGALVDLITTFFTTLKGSLNGILSNAWVIIATVLLWLVSISPQIANFIGRMLLSILNSALDFLHENMAYIEYILYKLVLVVVEAFINVLALGLELIQASPLGHWIDKFMSLFGFEEGSLGRAAADMKVGVHNWYDDMIAEAEDGNARLNEAMSGGIEETGYNAVEKTKEANEEVTKEQEKGFEDRIDVVRAGEEKVAKEQNNAMLGNEDMLITGAQTMGIDVSAAGYDWSNLMTENGEININALNDSLINNGESILPTAGESNVNSYDGSFDQLPGRMGDNANNAVDGFVNAATSTENKNKLAKAGVDNADTYLTANKAKLKEKSPSKATAEIAEFAVLGFVNKIYDGLHSVKEAGAEVSSVALKSMQNGIKRISERLNGDLDTAPVIRPVLDDSLVYSGIGNINSLMNGMNYTATGNLKAYGSIKTVGEKESMEDVIDKAVRKAVGGIAEKLNINSTIEVPLNIDGKRVAKATAQYTRGELAKLDKYNSRKGGKV